MNNKKIQEANKIKRSLKYSKSCPVEDFKQLISSEDSGIDSESSIASSISESDISLQIKSDPRLFILGADYPVNQRVNGIDQALTWIKDELMKIKEQDKTLTKTMISIRSKIANIKLGRALGTSLIDKGYNSDGESKYSTAENCGKTTEDHGKEKQWLISKENSFPIDSCFFDNGKRATWAI